MRKKETLKVNKNNSIESIIEVFQYFGRDYNVVATKLDKNIQYMIRKEKITQTYKTTILNSDINVLTKKLKCNGKITIIIIDNLKNKNKRDVKNVKRKIVQLNHLKNVKTRTTKKQDTLKTLESVIKEGGC